MGQIEEVEVQKAKKDLSMWQSKELHDQQVLEEGLLVHIGWLLFFKWMCRRVMSNVARDFLT